MLDSRAATTWGLRDGGSRRGFNPSLDTAGVAAVGSTSDVCDPLLSWLLVPSLLVLAASCALLHAAVASSPEALLVLQERFWPSSWCATAATLLAPGTALKGASLPYDTWMICGPVAAAGSLLFGCCGTGRALSAWLVCCCCVKKVPTAFRASGVLCGVGPCAGLLLLLLPPAGPFSVFLNVLTSSVTCDDEFG
jgi:hypothetical protein